MIRPTLLAILGLLLIAPALLPAQAQIGEKQLAVEIEPGYPRVVNADTATHLGRLLPDHELVVEFSFMVTVPQLTVCATSSIVVRFEIAGASPPYATVALSKASESRPYPGTFGQGIGIDTQRLGPYQTTLTIMATRAAPAFFSDAYHVRATASAPGALTLNGCNLRDSWPVLSPISVQNDYAPKIQATTGHWTGVVPKPIDVTNAGNGNTDVTFDWGTGDGSWTASSSRLLLESLAYSSSAHYKGSVTLDGDERPPGWNHQIRVTGSSADCIGSGCFGLFTSSVVLTV